MRGARWGGGTEAARAGPGSRWANRAVSGGWFHIMIYSMAEGTFLGLGRRSHPTPRLGSTCSKHLQDFGDRKPF